MQPAIAAPVRISLNPTAAVPQRGNPDGIRARVTDHAIRRYAERALGVWVEAADDTAALTVLRRRGVTLDGWGRFGGGWGRRVSEVQSVALGLCAGMHPALLMDMPEPAPTVRGAAALVAPSRTLPGKAAIITVVSAVGEKASEYAGTLSGLQDIAPAFKWAFATFTVLGILADLAKAIQLAQGAEPKVDRAARIPEAGAPIAAPPAAVAPSQSAPSADEFFDHVDAAEADLGPIGEDPADPELPPEPAEAQPTHVEVAMAAPAQAA